VGEIRQGRAGGERQQRREKEGKLKKKLKNPTRCEKAYCNRLDEKPLF